VLAFIAALFKLASHANLPFLPLYAWTGLWTSALLVVYSAFSFANGSARHLR
jgi:hypothetical protein